MDGREATVPIAMREGGSAEDWIKVNPQQIGFFRVNYSSEDWTRLRHAIEGLQLPAIDRLGLQNDAYALAKAGYVSVTRLLSLAGAYVNETNATVWEDLALNLGRLDTLLSDEPYYSSFRDLARGIFQPVGKRMGWEAKPGEGHLNALLRSTVLTQLGRYVDEDALGKASSLFSAYQDNTDSVHPDIRGVVFNLTAKRGDETTYEALWDMQKEATLEEEKVRLLLALTNFEQPALLEQTLERSLSDDVRVHDTILVVVRVGGNRHGRNMAWEFVKDNWKEFERRYSDGLFALSGLVGMTSRFNTQEQLEDVESFFEAHPTPTADRAIKQSLEVIRLNVAWLERNRADLAEWFGG
jgi:puromycin-sensitive aminopeptidase